jgi:hypothetical protein
MISSSRNKLLLIYKNKFVIYKGGFDKSLCSGYNNCEIEINLMN